MKLCQVVLFQEVLSVSDKDERPLVAFTPSSPRMDIVGYKINFYNGFSFVNMVSMQN